MLGIKISSIWKFQPSLTPLADPCDIVIRGLLTVSGLGHDSPGPRWETQEWTQLCLTICRLFKCLFEEKWPVESHFTVSDTKRPFRRGLGHQVKPIRALPPGGAIPTQSLGPAAQSRDRWVLTPPLPAWLRLLHFLPKRFFCWWVKIIPFYTCYVMLFLILTCWRNKLEFCLMKVKFGIWHNI